MPAARASLASVAKRPAPAISPTSLAAVSGPSPGSVSSCGATWATRAAISASSALIAGSARAGGVVRRGRSGRASSARPGRGAGRCGAPLRENNAPPGRASSGQRSWRFHCSVLLIPTRCGRAARGDRPAAGRRAPGRPARAVGNVSSLAPARPARPRARRSGRTCRARGRASRAAISLRRDPDHALAARDQEPLQRARDMPAILQRPDPLAVQAARPDTRAPKPRARPGPSSRPAPGRSPPSTAAIVCERLWVSAQHDHDPVLLSRRGGHPADTACWGRCHAPIKSRRTSPTGDERHNKRKSGHPGRQPQRSQLAARSGPSPRRRTSPTRRIQTASLKAGSRTDLLPRWIPHDGRFSSRCVSKSRRQSRCQRSGRPSRRATGSTGQSPVASAHGALGRCLGRALPARRLRGIGQGRGGAAAGREVLARGRPPPRRGAEGEGRGHRGAGGDRLRSCSRTGVSGRARPATRCCTRAGR